MKVPSFFLSVALVFIAFPMNSSAQGTAFTYQGQLVNNGMPANGSYDLTFTLFNTNCNGVAIAGPVTNSATAVTNGLFTTTIDFGASAFTGASNWLEIAVRTNGVGSFATLTPRQQITPTPYAIYSANAGAAVTATTAGSATSAAFATTATTASNALTAATITGSLPNASLSGNYTGAVTFNNSSNAFNGIFAGNGAGLTNDLRSLAVYVNSNYTVSASEVMAMQTTNLVYYVDTTAGNLVFTFPRPPVSANVTFSLVNFGTNTITLTNQPGTMFEIADGYSSVCTNEVTVGGYFDKVVVWQNFNATNWVQLANHRTVQEIRDIAAAYVGMVNGVGGNLTVNSNLTVNGLISGNGGGLTNLPFAKTFCSTNGYFTFTQNPDGSTNVTFVLTNLNAQNITGTLSETVLPTSTVLTNGASVAGQVPTWNGTNYAWLAGSQGNVSSNTTVAFSSVNTTNTTGTNLFAGSVVMSNLTVTGTVLFQNSSVTNSSTNLVIGGLHSYVIGNNSYYTLPVPFVRPLTSNGIAFDIMPNSGTSNLQQSTWLDICSSDFYTNFQTNLTGASISGEWLHIEKMANGDGSISPQASGTGTIRNLDLCNASIGSQMTFGANSDISFQQDSPVVGQGFGGSTIGSYNSSLVLWVGPAAGAGFQILYSDKADLTGRGNRPALEVTNNMSGTNSTMQLMTDGGAVIIGANTTLNSNLTVNGTISVKTNTAAFGPVSQSITLGSTFTNLTGGRADFVGQFTFNDTGSGNPTLVISNLTTGLVITNSFQVSSGTAMQGVVFPDVSPNDVCEAYDASDAFGASVSFVQAWWIVK